MENKKEKLVTVLGLIYDIAEFKKVDVQYSFDSMGGRRTFRVKIFPLRQMLKERMAVAPILDMDIQIDPFSYGGTVGQETSQAESLLVMKKEPGMEFNLGDDFDVAIERLKKVLDVLQRKDG